MLSIIHFVRSAPSFPLGETDMIRTAARSLPGTAIAFLVALALTATAFLLVGIGLSGSDSAATWNKKEKGATWNSVQAATWNKQKHGATWN